MDPFTLIAKMTYLQINMDAIKEDPNYWETLSHKKQVELHQIKKELDDFFAIKKELKIK